MVRWHGAVLLSRRWVQSDGQESRGSHQRLDVGLPHPELYLSPGHRLLRSKPYSQCDHCRGSCGPGADWQSTSQNLTGAINVLRGPLTIDCSGSDVGSCSFNSPFLGSIFGSQGLGLSGCTFGECVQQYVIDQAEGIATAVASGNSLSGGVIAGLAVVGAILLAIVALIVWGLLAQRRARRHMIADGAIPKSGGVGIMWTDVGYEVKTARHPWKRAIIWFKGSGNTQVQDQSSEGGQAIGPNGGKIVLRESCGQISPGGMVCILGPSGAGKSTLVDILAGKRKAGTVEGTVRFTHKDGGRRVKIGYVDQVGLLTERRCGRTAR